MSPRELWQLPATEIAAKVGAGTLDPRDVVAASLARMAEVDPVIHSFCTPAIDEARAAASALRDRIARGEQPGPLAGVPIGVKDLICTKDIRTTFGSSLYAEFVPEEDDIVVERLRAADAIILGKTNTYELGYGPNSLNPLFPATRNPWNPALTPGGSSAGSAAAVAAGICPVALGSDGGGSIRVPAAFCGLVGVKASMGRVPLYPGCRDERYPGVSGWESIEHIGPLARNTKDAALVLSVIAGPDPRDRHSIPCTDVDWNSAATGDVDRLRVGFSPDLGYATVDAEVAAVVADAVDALAAAGCEVCRLDLDWQDISDVFNAVVAMETDLTGMRALTAGGAVSAHIESLLRRQWMGTDFTDAVTQRKAIVNRMWRLMADYDILVTPTLAVPPFPFDQSHPTTIAGKPAPPGAWSCFTPWANLTGQPAASVPVGRTGDGLPVGLQLIGPHLGDAVVLRVASLLESELAVSWGWPLHPM